MTATMDHKNKKNGRKESWSSKTSISTSASSATRNFKRSPSSILSSDSDIRFTRKKLSSQCKCGCCIIASFLMLLLLAAAAIYVGYTFFTYDLPEEQVYRGTFKVTRGDIFTNELTNPSTETFKTRSRDYKERLNLLFRRSRITNGYVGSEILAFDGTEDKDYLMVHFNVHMDPTYVDVEAKVLKEILLKEFDLNDSAIFRNLTIDRNSLDVKESHLIPLTTTQPSTTGLTNRVVTHSPPPPRTCAHIDLKYCSKLDYNVTTYPNMLGHANLKEVEEDVIKFRELVDAECYSLAYEFVCQVLQPECQNLNDGSKEMVLPCRSFCRDFIIGCGSRLSSRIKSLLDCSRFPEFGNDCRSKPKCVQEMQKRALSPRICDGVVDCQDVSDESDCAYCPDNQIHCGIGRACILANQRCDGHADCPDGSDERACLQLGASVENVTSIKVVTPHLQRYNSEGFVIFNEKGEVGKLCTENLNRSLTENKTIEVLDTVATSLCKTLSYEKVTSIKIVKDYEPNIPYVKMKNPTASEISFVRSGCKSKQVLKMGCSHLGCGIQMTRTESEALSKLATHGDWPWHAALFKEDVHVCDATLVAPDWLVTTSSCFQGQPKADWTARFGTTRLYSTSPWQQERRIIGMVKSPVEGSTIAMVKLEQDVIMSDFIRPVCLLNDTSSSPNVSQCNTLGWVRNREQLQRVQVKFSPKDKCDNVSISAVNSLCTEPVYGQEDCNEEELAGTSMLCLAGDKSRWFLVGVSNWRIACSKTGVSRPRMYDKVATNVEWIYDTLSAIS